MRSSTDERSSRFLTGVFSALLASCLLAPTSASAACGDHAEARSLPAREVGFVTLLELADAGLSRKDPGLDLPAGRSKPCTGAMCSGHPAVPLSPMLTLPSPLEHWAWLSPEPKLGDFGSFAAPTGELELVPSEIQPSVFHPPRAPQRAHEA